MFQVSQNIIKQQTATNITELQLLPSLQESISNSFHGVMVILNKISTAVQKIFYDKSVLPDFLRQLD